MQLFASRMFSFAKELAGLLSHFVLYSHEIYNDKHLQYKSLGSMEMHNNPKTYT